jgi:glycine/D-amino acid oxidase-like deaminating enzyme/nitrite reductase/ring-hydroxylating ferredoxin subunit
MSALGEHRSLWIATAPAGPREPPPWPERADVAVVGAGVAGVTAAVLLARAGVKVALVEKGRVLEGETGHTTAHLTQLLDEWYGPTEKKFGGEGAKLVAASQRDAIERIARFVEEDRISCGFARVPAWLYAETRLQVRQLDRELPAMRRAGLQASFQQEVPLPFPTRGAIRIENQAQVHPREYLLALVERAAAAGASVHEGTTVLEVRDGRPCLVHTTHGDLRCDHVLVTTNHPVASRFWTHVKVAAYRTYALAARCTALPPPGLYLDLREPYHYTRTQRTSAGDFLVVGGEDHKTGHARDAARHHRNLAEYTRRHFAVEQIAHVWSGQVIEPADGLPFIGRSPFSARVYVATGFSGTGITFGTLAATMLADRVLGRRSPYADLYDATRVKPLAQAARLALENVDFPLQLAKDRLGWGERGSVAGVAPGAGRVVQVRGEAVACHRDEQGTLHALSAVCPHLGCHVRWNSDERSWDCPCHGSRFDVRGEVLNGPATRGLEPARVDDA